MASRTPENEVLSLENDYWNAIKDHDVDTALDLSDDGCIVVGAQGIARLDREQLRSMMECPSYTLREVALDDAEVTMLRDDVAVVAYKVREEIDVDGTTFTVEAADASTWVRRDGRWRCSLHTESLLVDPLGRDRQS